jgi:hypothetical protein
VPDYGLFDNDQSVYRALCDQAADDLDQLTRGGVWIEMDTSHDIPPDEIARRRDEALRRDAVATET